MELLCPICGRPLVRGEHSYACENRHSFDIARQGYVNLLPVQQKHSQDPGDTREQVLSRRAFLDTGIYAPILDTLIQTAKEEGASGEILDIGCGGGLLRRPSVPGPEPAPDRSGYFQRGGALGGGPV